MAMDFNAEHLIEVLQQLIGNTAPSDWTIARLGGGLGGEVFGVQSRTLDPIWRAYHVLVIKLYRPDFHTAHEQFNSLIRIHAALDGRVIDGWKISVPEPIYFSSSPRALVMSRAPGESLESLLLDGDRATPEMLQSVGRGVVAAMERYWSVGQVHGDFVITNMLCDIAARELSFVDAGTDICPICSDHAKQCHQAVCDLAHLLAYTTSVRSSLGRPGIFYRKRIFSFSVLRAILDRVNSREERINLLDQIRDCARQHVMMVEESLSPRGLWHAIRKEITLRRIDRTIARIRAEPDLVR